MASKAVTALRTASQGLVYSSESDAPFEVIEWADGKGPLTEKRLLELAGHRLGTPVQRLPLEKFFAGLTQEQPWHGPEEKAIVRRYQDLLAAVKEYLSDPEVFRVGEVELAIYLLGRSSEDSWVGLRTTAVET